MVGKCQNCGKKARLIRSKDYKRGACKACIEHFLFLMGFAPEQYAVDEQDEHIYVDMDVNALLSALVQYHQT